MTFFQLGHHPSEPTLFLAHASCAAYKDNPATYTDFNFQFDELIPFASKDVGVTRGFLAEKKDAIILAFRGTDDPWDWLINLNALQDNENGVRIHRGFKQALKSVWNQISEPLLKMYRQNKRKILITGHSLGGALAMLATRRLILNKNVGQIETYTFGQPRVGCARMGRQIISPFYRFAYSLDPVTYAPFKIFRRINLHYAHAGTLKHIDAAGNLHKGPPSFVSNIMTAYHAVKKIKGELAANDDLRAVVRARLQDHNMSHYIEKIAHAMKKCKPNVTIS